MPQNKTKMRRKNSQAKYHLTNLRKTKNERKIEKESSEAAFGENFVKLALEMFIDLVYFMDRFINLNWIIHKVYLWQAVLLDQCIHYASTDSPKWF